MQDVCTLCKQPQKLLFNSWYCDCTEQKSVDAEVTEGLYVRPSLAANELKDYYLASGCKIYFEDPYCSGPAFGYKIDPYPTAVFDAHLATQWRTAPTNGVPIICDFCGRTLHPAIMMNIRSL